MRPRFGLLSGCLFLTTRLLAADPSPPPPNLDAREVVAPAAEAKSESPAPAAPAMAPSEQLFWRALRLLESKLPAEVATGRRELQAAADQESADAQVLLANCHLSGSYGFPRDAKRAVNLFRLAATRNNAFAKVGLGSCYATGTGVKKDEARAVEWLSAALADDADFTRPTPPPEFFKDREAPGSQVAGELMSDPVASAKASAHFLLGQISARKNQLAEAQVHYVAAATAGTDGLSGIYQAAVEAAVNYAFGKGVPRDPVKANELLDQSRRLNARMGVSLIHNSVSLKMVDEFAVADLEEEASQAGVGNQGAVQYQIAQSLADKKSKDYNAAEAARWYELAANNGQAWAMIALGLMHARGELGAPDPAKAFAWFEKAGSGPKPKHVLGAANLALAYYHGHGTPKDPEKAAELFKKYRGDDIVCYLGSIGQPPPAVIGEAEELQLNLEWANRKNDPHAQYLMGLRYLWGYAVTSGPAETGRWLKKAAKGRHGEALCLLGVLYQFRPQDFGFKDPQKAARAAAENYKAAGEAGSLEGLANYANCLNSGYGVAKDQEAAIAIYEQCLKRDPNHARSHGNLAGIYNEKLLAALATNVSYGTVEWKASMLQHYEAAVALEGGYGTVGLGDVYYEGRLVPQDFQKAYSLYERAAEWPTQKTAAHFRLGFMHELGQGVPVTPTEAAYHYRLAALDGDIASLRRLVNFYQTGIGVTPDLDRAIFWLQALAKQGQLDALPAMADIFLRKGDYAGALRVLNELVESTNGAIAGFASDRLSEMYAQGQGVPRDPKRAKKYAQQAVDLGNGDAIGKLARQQLARGETQRGLENITWAARTSHKAAYNLGQLYYFGTGVTADPDRALRYLRQAADSNNPDALYFLAGLAYNRDPKAPSLDEAITFAQKAENLGRTEAGALREKLERRRQQKTDQPEESSGTRSS